FPLADRTSRIPESALAAGANYNYEGIVKLDNCSGSLVRFSTSRDDDRAMVLTNGHCLANIFGGGMPDPGTRVYQRAVTRSMSVLHPTLDQNLGRVHADLLIYATMTGTDIALYRLTSTYREVFAQFAVRPLTLSEQPAVAGKH